MSQSFVAIGEESLLIACCDSVIARGHQISGIVSSNADVELWAASRNIPVMSSIPELPERFDRHSFDWLLSIANLSVIPDAVLHLPAKGAVNFHDGPLPDYAGLHTPAWALWNGETQHGITWHLIQNGIDEGDILASERFDITPDDTAFTLNSKCYAAALSSFAPVLEQLEQGLRPVAQDLDKRRYFSSGQRPPACGLIDFRLPAADLARHVRALNFAEYWNPLGRAKIAYGETVLLITHATEGAETDQPSGTVLAAEAEKLVVATADREIVLTGLSGLEGNAFSAADLPKPGARITYPDPGEADKIDTLNATAARQEKHWRDALRNFRSIAAPLTARSGGDDLTPHPLRIPSGMPRDALVAGIMIWALAGGEAGQNGIGLSTAALRDARCGRLFKDWVPLLSGDAGQYGAMRNTIAAELARVEAGVGFASDLFVRDPQQKDPTGPAIMILLDHMERPRNCKLAVSLSGDGAVLLARSGAFAKGALILLARRLESILDRVQNANADTAVKDLRAITDAEQETTLTTWNDTQRPYNREATIHEAIAEQAQRTPDAVALIHENDTLSYAELDARSNMVAARLHTAGVRRGDHVGLFLSRTPDLVIAALAVFKAGGAYVPLDPDYPATRLAHYITDSQTRIIVTDSTLEHSLPDSSATVFRIDTPPEAAAPDRVDGGASASDLAYLIYTSGSTGTPKGVMISHRNVLNFFAGMDERIPYAPGDCWLAVTSLNFDISVLELFWTLARGFKVVLASGENRAAVANGPITTGDRRIDFNLMYWGNDDGPGPQKYQLLLEGAKFADRNGFNAVWTPERHFHAFGGPYPNPAVTGAAVAAVTQNLSVRAGSCVAPLHHPARIAEDWAVIDNLTAGRAAIGFASGWQPDDFVLRPENAPPRNKPAMFDAMDTVRRLWRGESVAFARADGTMHEVVTQPRPVSKELDVWVTTAGNPETWREAGAHGAHVLTHLLGQSISEVADKIRIYREALRAAGHDPENHKVTLMLHSYLAETREEARRVARDPMRDYLRSAAGLIKQYAWAFPAFKKPEGVSNPFEMDLGALSGDELEAILDFAFDRYFEDSGMFGTVADGLARVEELKRIGVDEVACLIDYGIPPEKVMDGLEPLAQVLAQANAPAKLDPEDFSLAAQIVRHKVTHLQCTPSLARIIAMNPDARTALGQVKHLLLGGEALPLDLLTDLRNCTSARIMNMYGPTETTIWSTCQPLEGTDITIGTPLSNTRVLILDHDNNLCPIGTVGELLIGGDGVAKGYWQRPDLTAERFIPDPTAAAGRDIRLYRTGDLARWRSDGRLEFLGRADSQIKIRGQRMELGEIEAALNTLTQVTAAVVVARMGSAAETKLIGYVTTNAPVDTAGVRQKLSRHLPEAMVPADIVILDQFPLTPNKKIDRAALPEPSHSVTREAAQKPTTETETRIAEIWAGILGVPSIGPDDNFFDLGGHSLLAVQAHRELQAALNLATLSITDVFRFPKLRDLARHISPEDPPPTQPSVSAQARSETMSRRRAMRATRRDRTG